MRARRAKRGGIAQVNSMRADAPRINLAQVAADARALLRRDGNYRRTVLTIALMMALTNVPIMILNYLPMIMAGAGGLMQDAQDAVDMRAMVFSLMVQLLVSPAISLGLARYELNMYNGRPCSPMDLFEGLTRGHYLVSVRAMLWRSLSMFVWMLIPVSLLTNGLIMAMAYGQLSVVLWLGLALVLVVLFNRGLAYSQQFYFLAQEPHVGAIMSLRLSTMVMHGRLKELFCLYLRFFYCFILTALPNVVLQVMANTTQLGFELTTAEQALVGVGVTLATIVLTSLCMPVLETASAIYFVRLNENVSRRAEEHETRARGCVQRGRAVERQPAGLGRAQQRQCAQWRRAQRWQRAQWRRAQRWQCAQWRRAQRWQCAQWRRAQRRQCAQWQHTQRRQRARGGRRD